MVLNDKNVHCNSTRRHSIFSSYFIYTPKYTQQNNLNNILVRRFAVYIPYRKLCKKVCPRNESEKKEEEETKYYEN